MKHLIAAVIVATLVIPAQAGGDKPRKGFWKILVKPNARWVLVDTTSETKPAPTLTVETYDVRKVGEADVARLRWTHRWGTGKTDFETLDYERGSQMPSQVAVTDKGIYLLSSDMDDAKIAAALKGKPSRSDPPKAYKGTKLNKGRYLRVDGDTVCMGEEPLPGDGDCADICEGEVCINATRGVISLHGTMSPNHDDYEQK
jgi:hypothetical protein